MRGLPHSLLVEYMDQDSVGKNSSSADIAELSLQHAFIQIKPLLSTDLTIRVYMLVISYVLNFQVILIISLTRSLWRPRNLFCCFICCMDLFITMLYTTESVAAVTQTEEWCAAFAMFFEIPYSMLLMCLTLASMDRYVAVYHPFFHIRNVTNCRVCCLCLLASALMLTAILSPYWTGWLIPTCRVNVLHMQMIWIAQVVLIALCLVLHVKVLVGARRAIRAWPIHVRFRTRHTAGGACSTPLTSSGGAFGSSLRTGSEGERYLRQFRTLHSITRLELRAAVTITLCIAPLWVFTIPLPAMGLAFCFCLWDRGIGYCEVMERITFSARELYMWHAIYNPIIYALTSREYIYAFRRLIFMCGRGVCRKFQRSAG